MNDTPQPSLQIKVYPWQNALGPPGSVLAKAFTAIFDGERVVAWQDRSTIDAGSADEAAIVTADAPSLARALAIAIVADAPAGSVIIAYFADAEGVPVLSSTMRVESGAQFAYVWPSPGLALPAGAQLRISNSSEQAVSYTIWLLGERAE